MNQPVCDCLPGSFFSHWNAVFFKKEVTVRNIGKLRIALVGIIRWQGKVTILYPGLFVDFQSLLKSGA